jgi:RNA polymerase subunit RPABC4/transcription elongation factor Spt4
MDTIIDLNSLGEFFVYLSAFLGAFLVALWVSLIFWTYRDIRSRSRDRIIQVLSTIIVALLTLPGLAIYLILRPKVTLDESYQKTLEEEALLTAIESRRSCPGCGAVVQDDWQICAHCHTRMKKACSHCDQLLELPWQMCPYCATPTPGSPHTVIELDAEISEDSEDLPDEELEETVISDDEISEPEEMNNETEDES